MITDALLVIVTKQLSRQLEFYRGMLGLDQIFDNQDTLGLGRDKRLFVVLREDKAEDSHHLATQKGPVILTLKCQGNAGEEIQRLKKAGCKVRDTVTLPEHNAHYIFIEDVDGNEICLDFPLSEEYDF